MNSDKHSEGPVPTEDKLSLYDLYFRSASDIFCYVDEKFIVREVSPAIEAVMGYTPDELIGRRFDDMQFFSKESLETARRNAEELLQGADEGKHEYDLIARDGSTVRLEITSAPLRMAGKNRGFVLVARTLDLRARRLERDLAGLREAEERLRESEERLKILFEEAPDAYYLNDLTGVFVDGNKMAEQVTGYKREELIGKNFLKLNLLSVDQIPRAAASLARNLMGKPVEPEEYTLNRKDGSQVLLEISTIPVKIRGKRFVLGIARDITQRKEAQEKLRKANKGLAAALEKLKATQAQVVQTERLRALGQMANGIAHDFNNALMPILGNADVIRSEPEILDDRQEAMDMIEDIYESAREAARTVRRLREFYRPHDEAERAELNLNDLAVGSIDYCRPRWQEEMRAKGVFIEVATDLADIPKAMVSGGEIRELLVNLIMNAADAIEREGTITVSTRESENGILLSVSDTGVGMSDEVRRHCIEPFFSTKREHGTGIGLSMAYGVAQRHNGRLDIVSTEGKGSTVSLWLPAERLSAIDKAGGPAGAGEMRSSMRVLCIDDEPGTRSVLKRYLGSLGHKVVLADNGASGVEAFKSEQPDLVIVDRAMPGMNGEQVATAIKRMDGATPVVMLTGFGTLMDDKQERPKGVDVVLTKPVTRDQLVAAIRDVS